jgi:hypothetical protein
MYDTVRVRVVLGATKHEPVKYGILLPEITRRYVQDPYYGIRGRSVEEYLLLTPWDKFGTTAYVDTEGGVHKTKASLKKAITLMKFKETCGVNQ